MRRSQIFTAAARVWHSEFADLASMEVEKAKAILTAAATGIFSDAGLLHCGHAWDSAAQPRREGEPQVSKYPHPSYKDIYSVQEMEFVTWPYMKLQVILRLVKPTFRRISLNNR